MAENMIKFLRGNVASLPATATAGAVYFTKDEGLYLGLADGTYHRYGDFITVANVAALPESGAHETCMYYCESENILARWNGTEWIQINKQKTLAELGGVAKSVYEAKIAALEKADTDNATAISGVDTRLQAAEKKLESVATTEGLAELQETVDGHTTALGVINGEEGTAGSMKAIAKSYADGKDTAIAAAQSAADAAQGEVDALETVVSEYKTATDARIKALEDVDNATQAEMDAAVATINGEIAKKANSADVYTKTEIDGKVTTLENADAAIYAKIGTVTEGKTVVEMIEAAKTAATYNDTEVRGLISDNAAAIAQEATDRGTAISGLKTELEGKIGAKVAQADYDAKVAELVAEDARIAGLVAGVETDYKAADTGLSERIAALESDITGLSGAMHFKGVETALPETTEGYNDGDTIIVGNKEYVVNGEAFVELGDVSAEVQRISDLEATINGTGEGEARVDGLVDKVADNAAAIATEKQRAEGKEAELAQAVIDNLAAAKKYTDDEIAELNIGDYVKKADADAAYATAGHNHDDKYDAKGDAGKAEQAAKTYADGLNSAMDARVLVVEGKAHEHANKALLDTYTQTEANLADAVAKKHEHTNAAVLNGITAAKVEAWDGAKAAAEQTATALNDAMDARVKVLEGINHDAYKAADETVLASAKTYADGVAATAESNAKSYADGLAKNYDAAGSAAAAQTAAEATAAAALEAALTWGEF